MTRRSRWRWAGAALGVGLIAAGVAWSRRDAWPAHAVLTPADPVGSHPQGFPPDGRTFQASGADGLTSWDVATGRVAGVVPPPTPGKRSFAGDRASFVAVYHTPRVPNDLAWVDAATGAVRARVALPSNPLFPPAWGPDDRSVRCLLAEAGGGLEVATWDLAADHVATRPLAVAIRFGGGGARALAPDGRTLACSGEGGDVVVLWDVEADRPIGGLHRGLAVLGGATALAFGPDGRTLVVGRVDGVIEVRDVADLHPIRTITPHTGGYMSSELAVAPDGRTLASTGFRHKSAIWNVIGRQFRWAVPSWGLRTSFETVVLDLATGRTLARAAGEAAPAFSPDGRWLVTRQPNSSYLVRAAPRPAPAGQ